jgi:O-antigen ligase
VAVVVAAMTSLLQTYGLHSFLFSENRAPGGTLGNRNFIAHVAAFGLPLVLLFALRALHRGAFVMRAIAVALVTSSLVLTRSRAAWLAFGVVLVIMLLTMLVSAPLRRSGQTWSRFVTLIVFTALAVGAVLVIPNALHWRGRNPYTQTMHNVADYQSGSGRGRLVQYTQSLRMALHHPLFGVGPGNWPVRYAEFAVHNDPSMDESSPGMTSNPWPSSDWVAFLSERGFAAVTLLVLVFLQLLMTGIRQLRSAQDVEEALLASALLSTIAGAGIVGLFDASLLLPVPAFLVWTTLGALWKPVEPNPVPPRTILVMAIVVLSAAGVAHSAMQYNAMRIFVNHSDRASLARAAQTDPGNYRLQLRLARIGGRDRCTHARAAHELFPNAQEAIAASRGCGR